MFPHIGQSTRAFLTRLVGIKRKYHPMIVFQKLFSFDDERKKDKDNKKIKRKKLNIKHTFSI
jgi:hypothetical protein